MKKKILSVVALFVLASLFLFACNGKDAAKFTIKEHYTTAGTNGVLTSYDIDGKEYVIFDQFLELLNPTIHRVGNVYEMLDGVPTAKKTGDDKYYLLDDGMLYSTAKPIEAVRIDSETYSKMEDEPFAIYYKDKIFTIEGGAKKVNDIIFYPLEHLEDVFSFKIENGEFVFETKDENDLEVLNQKDYDWYIDQKETGKYADNNCGPSCAVMSLYFQKGYDKAVTAETARNTRVNDGGWWFTNDVSDFLKDSGVKHRMKFYKNPDSLLKPLREGKICIICIDSSTLRYNPDANSHFNKYYTGGGGHFIVVNGYKVVDGRLYYIVNDPNSWGMKYADGSYMGKDRYYDAIDIDKTVRQWSKEYYVVDNN